jgi:hypothetical protein
MAHKSQTHQSYFSYSLTRPYPFRWFTPVAICLLTTAAILFSIVNVASSGYTLVVLVTQQPNKTLEQSTWLEHWPSFVTSKTRATCPPFVIQVKSELFTNNKALTYILTDIWRHDANGSLFYADSVIYQNNVLENCFVYSIDMEFESQGLSAVQLSYSEWGARVSAYTTCSILTPEGTTMLNLTMDYNYVPLNVRYRTQAAYFGSVFLTRNSTTKASLYWGESLLSMTWAAACRKLQDISYDLMSEMVTKGTLNFRPRPGVTTSITDLAFFGLDYQLIRTGSGLPNQFFLPPADNRDPTDIGRLDAEDVFPNMWNLSDTLAKAAYSAVLTDLGQVDAPHNLLLDPDQLQHFTANFSYWYEHIAYVRPGPLVQGYAVLKNATGPLAVTPSVFALDYICQVPRRKAWAPLIVSVLVADLVLLQATWRLYKLATDYFFVKNIPDGQRCEGCRKSSEAIPLMSLSTERVSEDLNRRTTV